MDDHVHLDDGAYAQRYATGAYIRIYTGRVEDGEDVIHEVFITPYGLRKLVEFAVAHKFTSKEDLCQRL